MKHVDINATMMQLNVMEIILSAAGNITFILKFIIAKGKD